MYKDFAYIYDELMDDVDYERWYKYIRKVIERNNKKVEDILEMACGTGRMSYYFLRDGYKMTCFDLSLDMLTVAENRLREFTNLKLLRHNMVDFKDPDSYDLVISNCDSINYIVDNQDLLKTFINVRRNLREDGLFVFDINSSYKLRKILGNNIFLEDREEIFYTWENYLYEEESRVEFLLTFFVENRDGSYRRFDEEHVERIYEIEEVRDLLLEAGFKEVEYYETFTFNQPEEESERITFLACK